MSEKTRKEWCENEIQNEWYFSWLLGQGQLLWIWRMKVTHLLLNFSYTVDPQGETHLQTVRVQIGVKKTSLGSTLLCVHVGKLYLHQCVCPEMQNYGQMMILGLLDTSSAWGRRPVLSFPSWTFRGRGKAGALPHLALRVFWPQSQDHITRVRLWLHSLPCELLKLF